MPKQSVFKSKMQKTVCKQTNKKKTVKKNSVNAWLQCTVLF